MLDHGSTFDRLNSLLAQVEAQEYLQASSLRDQVSDPRREDSETKDSNSKPLSPRPPRPPSPRPSKFEALVFETLEFRDHGFEFI
jgi:hypothetical protein